MSYYESPMGYYDLTNNSGLTCSRDFRKIRPIFDPKLTFSISHDFCFNDFHFAYLVIYSYRDVALVVEIYPF